MPHASDKESLMDTITFIVFILLIAHAGLMIKLIIKSVRREGQLLEKIEQHRALTQVASDEAVKLEVVVDKHIAKLKKIKDTADKAADLIESLQETKSSLTSDLEDCRDRVQKRDDALDVVKEMCERKVDRAHTMAEKVKNQLLEARGKIEELRADYKRLCKPSGAVKQIRVSTYELTGKEKGWKLAGHGLNGQSVHSDPQIFNTKQGAERAAPVVFGPKIVQDKDGNDVIRWYWENERSAR